MSDAAATQFTRIVHLLAELTRREAEGLAPLTLEAIGALFGVPAATIERDVRTFTMLDDEVGADWLLSVRLWQQGDVLSGSSRGPFRRPARFSPDERLALRVALACDPEGPGLLAKLDALEGDRHAAVAPARRGDTGDRYALVCQAIAACIALELLYVGEGERQGTRWVIEPHQLVSWRGRDYVVAWCPEVAGWRHFRLDRMLDALPLERRFQRRGDFVPIDDPGQLFRPSDVEPDAVRVRFSRRFARLARERYGEGEKMPDGSVVVTLRASSPAWLVRRILEYGAEAEVLEPEAYREAVRRAVA